MSEDVLLETREGRVAILTLNRPDKLNALNMDLILALEDGVRRVATDDDVGCVVITGAGRGFCSGGDLGTKKKGGADADPDAPVLRASFEERMRSLHDSSFAGLVLHEMDKPTIAMINGPCAGAGITLAGACDFRFMGRSAMMKSAFNEVGLTGDYGGSWFWTQILGTAKAREFYLLSEKFDAERALAFGLVHRIYDDEALTGAVMELATRLAERKPWAARLTKTNLNYALHADLRDSLDREALSQTLASQALGAAFKQQRARETKA
jgi:2-(1,2-epoxy-1,2-dihydrophenyl)acetyl-CoA isomerase